MNGPASSPTATTTPAEVRLDPAAIDASCRALLLPLLGGVKWLVISALLALVSSIKLHSPTFLANCPWLTYGTLLPAARDAFAYGFASQVGLAVALWMLCRLGRTALVGPVAVTIASAFWNLGVALGVFGILAGDSTGFEWLEFPRYGSAIMFGAYVVIGVCGFLTFAARRESELYVSQWYILAALLWFPWLYTTARLLLVFHPVRGVMQVVVNSWFISGFFTLWLGGLVLAILLYFIPKLSGQALFSRALAVFGFWTLAVFGCWGALYKGLPVPSWIIGVSVGVNVLLLVPLIANVMNLWQTLRPAAGNAPLLGFFKTSLAFLVIATVLNIGMLLCGHHVRLTLFADGVEMLTLYGVIGFALFGAVHYIVPRVTGEFTSEKLLQVNGWCTLLGVLIFAVPMLVGGYVQGTKLGNASVPFLEVMNSSKMFLRLSTLGLLLLVVGNTAIFLNVLSAARRCCAKCCSCCVEGETEVRTKLNPAKAR